MATREQIDELIAKMTEQRERLIAQAAALSDEEATRQPVDKTGEEQWTVKEQLAHLAEMELSYDAWVQAALEQDDPNLAGLEPPRPAIPIEAANQSSVPALLAQLAGEREQTLAMIAAMSPEQFDRTAMQPMFGSLTALQWLRSFYRHDRMHADQIAGRDPEYKPKFTAPEPNQRRMRLERVARERAARDGA